MATVHQSAKEGRMALGRRGRSLHGRARHTRNTSPRCALRDEARLVRLCPVSRQGKGGSLLAVEVGLPRRALRDEAFLVRLGPMHNGHLRPMPFWGRSERDLC